MKNKITKQEKENTAIDAVIDAMEVDVPDCMVESRIESTIRENNARMAQQGISFEQYLGFMGTTVDQFKEQVKPNALLQVKGTLALEEIAKLEKLEATDAEIDEQLQKMADAYNMELAKVKEFMRDEDIEALKSDIKITKAMDLIVANATWTKAKKTAAKSGAAKKDAAEEAPKKTTTKKSTTTKKASETAEKKTTTKKASTTTAKKETAEKKPAAKKTTTKSTTAAKKTTTKKAEDK